MISVIVPTHNRLESLQKKLQALEGQSGDIEVVVVMDGCTDGTQRFLAEYNPPFPLQTVVTGDSYGQGKGAAFARNRGVEAAKGEILLFSDDDVIPQAGWIQAHQQAHLVPRAVVVGRLLLPPQLRGCGAAELPGPGVFWWNITGNNTSLSRALFEDVGGYDESFASYGGEDPDLGYRLMQIKAKLVYAPEALAIHEAWDYPPQALKKARQAGSAQMRVWLKHRKLSVAWALGVHPVMLALKMALLPSLKVFAGTRLDNELAYCWGAWETYEDRKAK